MALVYKLQLRLYKPTAILPRDATLQSKTCNDPVLSVKSEFYENGCSEGKEIISHFPVSKGDNGDRSNFGQKTEK